MSKLLILFIWLILLCVPATGQSYNFAEMKWDISMTDVRQNLTSKGFKVTLEKMMTSHSKEI
ncbi:MAG: hypothetical protein QOD75_722 [Blastocatellia bacterium]|nr:hypothetical protein [Blastocatellia bacterium]